MKRATLGITCLTAALITTSASVHASVQTATPQASMTQAEEHHFEERALRTRAGSYLRRFDDPADQGDCRTRYQVRLKHGSTECIRNREQ